METIERTFRQNVDLVVSMLKPDYDWEKHYKQDDPDSLADLFRKCVVVVGSFKGDENKEYYACGSSKVKETHAALYRLLYLLKPPTVDFSYMYKTCLLVFFSADERFQVTVELFKYELGLYFYCPREVLSGKGYGVICGSPGFDNGWFCSDEDGKAFFEMVQQCVHHTWEVYPGNNFCV